MAGIKKGSLSSLSLSFILVAFEIEIIVRIFYLIQLDCKFGGIYFYLAWNA